MIEFANGQIAVSRQCELLNLARSSAYYKKRGDKVRDEALMRVIDRHYTMTPFYGVRRMTALLRRTLLLSGYF